MRRLLILVSLSAHVVLVLAFLVAGLWHIDRLEAARRPFDLAYVPPHAEAGGGGDALPKPELRHKKIAKGVTQPPKTKPTETANSEAKTTTGIGTGDEIGPGKGPGTPTDIGSCEDPPCGESNDPPQPPEPPKVEPPKPTAVPASVLRALRISGETQIQPPDTVKTQMIRDDQRRLTPVFEVCISTSGDVSSVRQLHLSGYAPYDAALLSAIHAWRYRPDMADGHPVPACGIVTFAYTIE